MPAGKVPKPDWRDEAQYCALLDADRSLIAWEWLRRDAAYADAARRAAGKAVRQGFAQARRFGLVAFEDPDLGVPAARPLWDCSVYPFALESLRAADGPQTERFDWRRFGPMARLVTTPSADHLLLSDGWRTIRLDTEAGLFAAGPVRLAYRLEGLGAAQAPLLTLRRFLAFNRAGRFSTSLHPGERRSARWVQMLRAWDALQEGAGQREIAKVLLSPSAGEADWRIRNPSLRSRAQRLARLARTMAGGGYRALLR